ncbi:MAG: FtsX-like permease family protein [Acidobacteria bacterium]|nr:FtsX-like permease family protein [Acidobacteriota bacterium]
MSVSAPSPLRGRLGLELRFFRLLIRIYGAGFRDRYEEELVSFFCRDRVRDRYAGVVGTLSFWRLTLRDLAATAARERAIAGREKWRAETVFQDIGFALRQIKADPGFSITAIFILAVAIGASTAVFSAVNGVVLRPLPYPEPDSLYRVFTRFLPESGYDFEQFTPSPREIVAYSDATEALVDVGLFDGFSLTFTAEGLDPTRLSAVGLDDRMMNVLGVHAEIGRRFGAEDMLGKATFTTVLAPVALLSHRLWVDQYGSDPAIVGQTMTLDGSITEIIGVMPAGFSFPSPDTDIYVPYPVDRVDPGDWGWHGISAIGRLADGVTIEQAREELAALNARWREEFGHPQEGHFLYLEELHGSLIGDAREALWMLMAAVLLVLTIGAVNVASLLLARGETRASEIRLRMALGAGRARLIRQMLTESTVLAVSATVLGVGLAGLGLDAVLAVNPRALPRMDGIAIDTTVLGFSLLACAGTALVFGLAPAVQASRASMSERTSADGAARKRLRSLLVSTEVAISVVVVLSAGLVVRSFTHLSQLDAGFNSEGRITFGMYLPEPTYPTNEEVRIGVTRLVDELRATPGVTGVAFTSALPISGPTAYPDFYVQGRPEPAPGERRSSAQTIVATPGYMNTMGIDVLAGRAFEATDTVNAPPVAIFNQTAVDTYWPGENPVGDFVQIAAADAPWIEVVGVIEDVRTEGLDREIQPQLYLPFEQEQGFWQATSRIGSFVIRTPGDPTQLVPGARAAVAAIDPNLPLENIRTAEDLVARSLAGPRLITGLLGGFAGIALLLALVGVYGIVSHSVARRTREIGIRQALGAGRTRVLWMMVREGAAPAFVGLGIGLAAAFVVTEALTDLLYQVSPRDPATFVALPIALAGVAVFASWIPSRRATRVTPVEALRSE